MVKHIILASLCAIMAVGVVEAKPLSKCLACHSPTHQVKMCTGFEGIYNSPAGKAKGVRYSKSFDNATWSWDDEHLRAWMCDSKKAIKVFTDDDSAKTKMPKMRICDTTKQDEVLAALKELNK